MLNVTFSTGQLCHFALDFSFPGFIPVEFDRFYLSQLQYLGPLGQGWTFPYQSYLEIGEERLTFFENVYSPTIYEFKDIGRDGRHSQSGTKIVRLGNSVVFERPDGAIHFSAVTERNRLLMTQRFDGCGNALSFDFDSRGRLRTILDTMGRRFRFAYTPTDHIREIALLDITGHTTSAPLVRYEYDPNGRLTAAIDPHDQASRYEYDDHFLVAYTNRNGGRFLAQYDEVGRCARTWRDDGRLLREYRYDSLNSRTVVTDAKGRRAVYRFSKTGLTMEEVNVRGDRVAYVYDEADRLITSTDETGASALTLFAEPHKQFTIADRSGATVRMRFFPEQSAREITDASGAVWRYEYDATGRLARFVSPSGAAWTYQYDSRGAMLAQTSPTGRTVRYAFNADYTQRTTLDDLGVLEQSRYDGRGSQIELIRALEEQQLFEYDGLGRLAVLQHSNGSTVRCAWDNEGNLTSITEADGSTVRLEYSRFNELLAVVNRLGQRRRYEYDPECYLTRIWSEKNAPLELEYDDLDRVARQKFADGRVEVYEYDRSGRLSALVNSSGARRQFELDSAGRLVRFVDGEGQVTDYSYNPNGVLVGARCGEVQVSFEYDQDGRLIAETQGAETLQHTYDAAGNRLLTRLPDGAEIAYVYDRRNRVVAIETPTGQEHRFSYDERDRPIKWSPPGGATTAEYSYHRYDRPKSLQVTGGTRIERAYEYDARGRLRRVSEGSRDTDIVYSVLDEILELRHAGVLSETYRYDETGNLVAAGSRIFAVGADDRLYHSGDRSYQYDGDGRLTVIEGATGRTVLTYDGLDRLIRVDHPDNKTTSYTYDPLGRRLSKTTNGVETRYLWQMDQVITQQTFSEGPPLVYVRLPVSGRIVSMVDGGSDYALIGDPLGFPPTHLLDSEGRTVWSARYAVWGGAAETTANGISSQVRYPGQFYDSETGLHYNYHRYYDPDTARFITPDPIGINGGMLNMYLYAPNPIGYIDPLGLAATTVQCSQHCGSNPSPPCKQTKQSNNVPNQITAPCNKSRGSSIHNDCINQAWDKAKAVDPNARRDQGQVAGSGIGSNRPDLSFTPPGGPQTFIEIDNPPCSRVGQHLGDICGNNPSAQVMLVAIPATSRFVTPGSATSGSIPRNTPGRPTEAECGW